MNPAPAFVLLVFAVASGFAPWRRGGWTTAARSLLFEAGALSLAIALAWVGAQLVHPTRAGFFWGRVLLVAGGYWYVCAGGAALVRRVLDLVPVEEAPSTHGIVVPAQELSRGRLIGVLERALALTLVLAGQYGALGLILAAKALARFRALDDRDFAEYVLIGTLASLLFALLIGMAIRLVL
jgi:hypothetical protein